jgi:hypothetical protein
MLTPMDEFEIRLECLRLAQAGATVNSAWAAAGEVVDRARHYHDLVKGANDAEIIDAAREFTKRVNG